MMKEQMFEADNLAGNTQSRIPFLWVVSILKKQTFGNKICMY